MMVRSAAPSLSLRSEPLAKEPAALVRTTKTTGTKDPVVWNVEETVVSLPAIYMLERTHTTVEASPAEVAKCIIDCLRRESIYASYDDKEVRLE